MLYVYVLVYVYTHFTVKIKSSVLFCSVLKLDDESSNLTTATTLYGRYKWLRLPFGTIVSTDIFAKMLYDCIHDLSGIQFIA